jgi:predicted transcriptional regulator
VPLFNDEEPQGKIVASSVRLPESLWARLDAIADVETEYRKKSGKKPPVISRNDVIQRFLERAVEAYEAKEPMPRKR